MCETMQIAVNSVIKFFSIIMHIAVDEKYIAVQENSERGINPLTPAVAIWVHLQSILCQTRLSRHL